MKDYFSSATVAVLCLIGWALCSTITVARFESLNSTQVCALCILSVACLVVGAIQFNDFNEAIENKND